jgi:poly(3-hydroxybutyrate) depolymerase
MNYQAYDFFARSGHIMHDGLSLYHDVFLHPTNPISHSFLGKVASASLETAMRLTRRYEKPDFQIDEITLQNRRFKVEETIVLEQPFCNLVHFDRIGHEIEHKVLLVAPLSGHHATLLKGTVEALLPDHEVYITDWLDAREVPVSEGPFSFDCYVEYLINMLEFLGPDTSVIAICQPTVQALIASAVMAQNKHPCAPTSLTLMAGPIDTSKNPTRVNEFSQKHSMAWFRQFAIMKVPPGYPGEGRLVYPGFMQLGGFISMNHKSHMEKYANYFMNLLYGEDEDADRFRAFYDEYLAVLDMPAEFYLETIERVFKGNELAKGSITYKNEPVDFSAIVDMPLLTVEGANDDICGLGQTQAAQTICKNIPKSKRVHHVQQGAGHYGIFSGSKFRRYIRPLVTDFIHKYEK